MTAFEILEGSEAEIREAWEAAHSVAPGDVPKGKPIGACKTGNTIYSFYKDGPVYEYISRSSGTHPKEERRIKRWEKSKRRWPD